MTPLNLFPGETALVTGSASNIGRAIALALAHEGAAVRCVDIDAARNAAIVEEITKAGGTAEAVTADLSTTDGWRAALPPGDQPVSMFVHSASPPRRETDTALAVSEATWDAMVNTNVRSGFLIARELARRMKAGGIKGRLLFITSLHAETPRNIPHYAASKAGQTMVVKELARALGPCRHPRQCAGAGRRAGRRLQCGGFRFLRQDPARPPWRGRRHGQHGARPALGPLLGLRDGHDRGRRRRHRPLQLDPAATGLMASPVQRAPPESPLPVALFLRERGEG